MYCQYFFGIHRIRTGALDENCSPHILVQRFAFTDLATDNLESNEDLQVSAAMLSIKHYY